MKAYDAENKVFARRNRVLTMQECRDIADKLFAHWGVEPIRVDRTRGGRADSWSHYWHPRPGHPNGFIRLSNKAADWLVCHEVAHYVAHVAHREVRHPRSHNPGHGKLWAEVYVESVRVVIGDTYADRLDRALTKARARS